MDEVEEMMENETNDQVQRAERWFQFAVEYPPAPYLAKINLTNILKNIDSTSSPKLDDVVEHESPSVVTPDCGMPSSEEKLEGLKYHDLFADDQTVSAKSKSTKRSSKPSKTFMKPTASHLAKQVAGSCGRTPEETKRQKLEIGFLRKVSHLKHQTSFSHKSTAKDAQSEGSSSSRSKTTIPQKPRLMTEERAQRRSFMSQKKAESHAHNFKALPLNRKIFESPSLSMPKKSVSDLPELQKFIFTYDN
ncbi:TPX2 [Artemisia annua]|uniref:TPX2 n=1 Tax=Artemisia annua TaxID=35608 RepID=A0A2U1Q248_ARTAN|nr:TPX2 [Artemisia annua]